jgi:L-ascorbate metabolism protein UlaG (beta-lactamase superfamily)
MEINGIKIEYLGHDGFIITNKKDVRIAIDPFNIIRDIEKVDYVLITHSHYDHCSIKDIKKFFRYTWETINYGDFREWKLRLENS